ncbi:AAA family ATPase [Pichia kluyveri]|uniref:Cell division control protein n=1 Tax=Pichia kluyveri TaxID=36015 RepID=A0AAV5RBI3_PICKL|nr:AAA family ATPase [Pichia kluyveri]
MSLIQSTKKRSNNHINNENDENLIYSPENSPKKSYNIKRKKTDLNNNSSILKVTNDLGLLSPPVTPKHLISKSQNLTTSTLKSVSKNLTQSLKSEDSSYNQKSIIYSDLKDNSPYSKAKNLFLRSSNPYSISKFVLSGREKEASILKDYIFESLNLIKSNSIYVSGAPGTGKSAQMNATLNELTNDADLIDESQNIYFIRSLNNEKLNKKVRIIKFNCMSINSPTELFKEIYQNITGLSYRSELDNQNIYNLFTKNSKNNCDMNILILDEMDNIITKSQQSLFELFTWASDIIQTENKPNILLIGIANSLNLTDRFLPRLRANCINPKLVSFLPYTADQIRSVISNKLISLQPSSTKNNSIPIVHPAAIQFCSKKAAVTNGDLRRAFDIMYSSLNLFQENLFKSTDIEDLKIILDSSITPLEKIPKMTITSVVKVCSQSFNANFDLKLKPLTIQQKMILAFLFKHEEKIEAELQKLKLKSKTTANSNSNTVKTISSANDISLKSFFEYYIEKCKDLDHVTLLKRSEFLEIISSLDNQGIVNLSMIGVTTSTSNLIKNRNVSLNFDNYKITPSLPKHEFIKNVSDIVLLKKIIYSSF